MEKGSIGDLFEREKDSDWAGNCLDFSKNTWLRDKASDSLQLLPSLKYLFGRIFPYTITIMINQ